MHSKPAHFILLLSALLLVACSKPESQAVSEPQADAGAMPAAEPLRGPDVGEAGGADPTVVDPGHYMAEFENDAVRILRIKYGAGEESVMHYHPNSVAVFLTDAAALMTMGDGSTAEISEPAGTVVYGQGGEHKPKNIGDSPWEVVEIELKARTSAEEEAGGPDPTIEDPDHYTTEFENDAVRVLRISYGAGEESVMHYHPDSVAVFLNDLLVQMTMPDGSTAEVSGAAGEAVYMPGGLHQPKNVSDSDFELVQIELK